MRMCKASGPFIADLLSDIYKLRIPYEHTQTEGSLSEMYQRVLSSINQYLKSETS